MLLLSLGHVSVDLNFMWASFVIREFMIESWAFLSVALGGLDSIRTLWNFAVHDTGWQRKWVSDSRWQFHTVDRFVKFDCLNGS